MFIRFWKTNWQFLNSPKPMIKTTVVRGATKKDSGFIPVVGGQPKDHNFRLIENKLVIGADNSNVSDDCLLFLGNDSSARSYVKISEHNKVNPLKVVTASNAEGNQIEVAVILNLGESFILRQTGRYARWQSYTWNGEVESKIYSDKEEFYFVFGIDPTKHTHDF